VFADLGAGYGRWLVNAYLAARQLNKKAFVIGVEAEVTHYRWMLEHFQDNGMPPSDYRAVAGAVLDQHGKAFFTEGSAQDWYGQAILPSRDHGYGSWSEVEVVEVKTIPGREIFAGVDRIDGLHVDIQGAEERVVPHLFPLIDKQVRLIHVSTHSEPVHAMIGEMFKRAGWAPRRVMPFGGRAVPTEIGPINTNDGLQSWRNPRFN
jgi:FkbM family methyltransferase